MDENTHGRSAQRTKCASPSPSTTPLSSLLEPATRSQLLLPSPACQPLSCRPPPSQETILPAPPTVKLRRRAVAPRLLLPGLAPLLAPPPLTLTLHHDAIGLQLVLYALGVINSTPSPVTPVCWTVTAFSVLLPVHGLLWAEPQRTGLSHSRLANWHARPARLFGAYLKITSY